jgi:hypothetical protein
VAGLPPLRVVVTARERVCLRPRAARQVVDHAFRLIIGASLIIPGAPTLAGDISQGCVFVQKMDRRDAAKAASGFSFSTDSKRNAHVE